MFDDDLVSNDKTLKLNISDKTQIIMAGTNQELSAKILQIKN